MSGLIRALIVDDSAFARKVVREMLSRSPFIEVVGAARDGEEALEMAEELEPDVITCDLVMPRCDGVQFVRRQMERRAIPILLLTATPEDGERAMEAMDAGAIDIVRKPTALASDVLLAIQSELIEKVKAVAKNGRSRSPHAKEPVALQRTFRPGLGKADVLLMGLSTGGPQAVRHVLAALPADFPLPIAIVVHMPIGYTALLAERLDKISALHVVEASEGEPMLPGKAVLARSGRHLRLRRRADGIVVAHLATHPMDSPHRPSVDALFESAAEIYGERTLGAVFTGMGNDGTRGAAWIKAKGGTVLTEAEQTCVVYGMPRAVVEAGLSDAAIPLSDMPRVILQYL